MSTTKSGPRLEPAVPTALLSEPLFLRLLCLERKRAERSDRPFLLVLLESAALFGDRGRAEQLAQALTTNKRETDFLGWHQSGAVLGIVYTEIEAAAPAALRAAAQQRIAAAWAPFLSEQQLAAVRVSFHMFPERRTGERHPAAVALYPDLAPRSRSQRAARIAKRLIDVLGASFALLLFAPVLACAAVAIKLNSQGPVLYCQQRLGQFGRPFTLLKFRSMKVVNDSAIHREYIKQFIAGRPANDGNGPPVFKIQNDPRVTAVGRWLRKTSFDELPQFWNVLRGEMSLVGPRPPIPYEIEHYRVWHHRRVLEAKPGITGLWQVYGRSRTAFDEMVRLDLRYVRNWSLWLDLKILIRTPVAVIFGAGAY